MTILFDARDSGNIARRFPAPGPPATLGETAESTALDILANDMSFSANMLLRAEYERYLEEIETESGQAFDNPYDVADDARDFTVPEPNPALKRFREQMGLGEPKRFARAKTSPERERELFDQVQELKSKFPDLNVRTPEQIQQSVVALRRQARERRAAVAERETTFALQAAGFATGAGVFLTDPPILASMAFGAPTSIGILRAAAIDAGIAGAVEIPIQATVQAARARLGEETSLSQAAINVLTVGAGGFLFSGALRGGVKGTKKLVTNVRDFRLARTQAQRDAQAFLERQLDLEEATPFDPDIPAARAEHEARFSEAGTAVREGRVPRFEKEPAFAIRAEFIETQKVDVMFPAERLTDEELSALPTDAARRIAIQREIRAEQTPQGVETAEPTAPALAPVAGDPNVAVKLREKAGGLQKQIDAKRSPAIGEQRFTERRARIARGMAQDADALEKIQTQLRGLADLHERGQVPEVLAGITSKAQLESLRFSYPTQKFDKAGAARLKKAGIVARNFDEAKQSLEQLSADVAESQKAQRARGRITQRIQEIESRRGIKDFFQTPEPLAERMVELADIRPGMAVLEPSAGAGAISRNIRDAAPDANLTTVEQAPSLVELLREQGFEPRQEDFLELTGAYDRIIMNPPFSKGQDVDHLRHAYELLKPGGRVVSIMSPHGFFAKDKKSANFRAWLEKREVDLDEELPANIFEQTGVNAKLVVIDKPGEAVTELTEQGVQRVIPGAERTAGREFIEAQAEKRIKGTKAQKAADEGIFDVAARGQRDLLDEVRETSAFDEGPERGLEEALKDNAEALRDEVQIGLAELESAKRLANFVRANRTDEDLSSFLEMLRKPPKRPRVTSLIRFLQNRGGIKDVGGNLKALGLTRGRPGLINNKTGSSLDDAALAATEAGYFGGQGLRGQERVSINELLDAIADESRGVRRLDTADEIAMQDFDAASESVEAILRDLDEIGIDIGKLSDAEVIARLRDLERPALAEDVPSEGTLKATTEARAERAALEELERDADSFSGALERQVLEEFEDRLDDRVWIEDEAGNVVETRVGKALEDLDEDEVLLNEFRDCIKP